MTHFMALIQLNVLSQEVTYAYVLRGLRAKGQSDEYILLQKSTLLETLIKNN